MSRFWYEHGRIQRDRPPIPGDWPKTLFGTPPVPMAWHHMIPFSQLRDCWNTLARQYSLRTLGAAALHTYFRILGYPHEQAKRLMANMIAGKLDPNDQSALEFAVAYPKWDLIEGPLRREPGDDPEDDFDEFAAGLTDVEMSRQARLKSLHFSLKIFNEASVGSEEIPREVIGAIGDAFAQCERTLLSCTKPISFRESMWKPVAKPGEPEAVPAACNWIKAHARRPGTTQP